MVKKLEIFNIEIEKETDLPVYTLWICIKNTGDEIISGDIEIYNKETTELLWNQYTEMLIPGQVSTSIGFLFEVGEDVPEYYGKVTKSPVDLTIDLRVNGTKIDSKDITLPPSGIVKIIKWIAMIAGIGIGGLIIYKLMR